MFINVSRIKFLKKSLSVCSMLEILVSIYLISLMIGRWTLPIKRKFPNPIIAKMMLEYIANGADIVHMFAVIDEEKISISSYLTNAITGNENLQ